MPELVPISHRELARKLRRAGYVEIRTSRHPVYYLAEEDITVPVPAIRVTFPKAPCGPSSEKWASAWRSSLISDETKVTPRDNLGAYADIKIMRTCAARNPCNTGLPGNKSA